MQSYLIHVISPFNIYEYYLWSIWNSAIISYHNYISTGILLLLYSGITNAYIRRFKLLLERIHVLMMSASCTESRKSSPSP